MIKKILIVLLVILVTIQFIHPKKNQSAGEQPNAIAKAYPVPQEVTDILKVSCNDCHSNNTHYPWYNNIQPVAWWMNNHVNGGKKELNFDEFTSYTPQRAHHKLDDLIDEVKEGGMPLPSYTWIHKNAILSEAQKSTLINWAQSVMDSIASKYNLPEEEDQKERP
ncbi:MAG: cytochrome C [Sphingobacteriales bacterium]|nr:MAG: cytochrome C [Sphingobacteriales bacterium]